MSEQGGKRLRRDGWTLLLGEGGARLLAFIASYYLARQLGPTSFGIITIGITVLSYALWPSDLGMQQIGTRESALPGERRRLLLGAIFRLRLFLGAAGGLLAAGLVLLLVEDERTRLVSILYLLALLPTILQSEWYFQGKQRYGSIAVVRYLFGGLFLAGVLFLVEGSDDLLRVPIIYAGALAVAATAAFLFYRGDDPPYRLQGGSGARSASEVLRLSTPVGLGGLLVQGVQLLPPILLALVATEETVGYFGAAFRLVLAAMIVDRIFISLYFPRVTAAYGEGRERFATLLQRTWLPLLIGAFLVSLVLSLFSAPLVELLYGAEYREAAAAVAILAWFLFGSIMTSFFSYPLLAAGIERAYFRSSLASAIVTIILMILGAFTSGLLGVCAALAAGEIITALLMHREFRRGIGVGLLRAGTE